MRISLVLVGLFVFGVQGYCQIVKDSISYSLTIQDYSIGLSVPLEESKWIKNKFLGIEQAYYNSDLDLQLIFNKDLLKKNINEPSEGLNYLVNNFNTEYDLNKAYFTYNPKNKVYKCFYNDLENSFIIYLYFYENYIVYTSFYSQRVGDKVGVLNINNQSLLDDIYFNLKLKISKD